MMIGDIDFCQLFFNLFGISTVNARAVQDKEWCKNISLGIIRKSKGIFKNRDNTKEAKCWSTTIWACQEPLVCETGNIYIFNLFRQSSPPSITTMNRQIQEYSDP